MDGLDKLGAFNGHFDSDDSFEFSSLYYTYTRYNQKCENCIAYTRVIYQTVLQHVFEIDNFIHCSLMRQTSVTGYHSSICEAIWLATKDKTTTDFVHWL